MSGWKNNKNDANKIINTESSNISKDNSIELEEKSNKSQIETKEDKIKKTKELIKKLLKESLDQRLIISEKKGTNHMNIIKTTLELTKSLTNITKVMNKQRQEKLKKDKGKQNKLKQNRYGRSNKRGISPRKPGAIRTNHSRAKTPSHMNRTGTRDKSSTIMGLKRELIKNRANMDMLRSSKTIQTERGPKLFNNRQKIVVKKRKSSNNIKKFDQINDAKLDELQTISIASLNTNKTNTTFNTVNNSRTNIRNP